MPPGEAPPLLSRSRVQADDAGLPRPEVDPVGGDAARGDDPAALNHVRNSRLNGDENGADIAGANGTTLALKSVPRIDGGSVLHGVKRTLHLSFRSGATFHLAEISPVAASNGNNGARRAAPGAKPEWTR